MLDLARRRRWAMVVAAASDLAQLAFFPVFAEGAASPFAVVLDVVTAAIILAIVGFRWRLMIALLAELVPGLDLFPSWTAMVMSLPSGTGAHGVAPRLSQSGRLGEKYPEIA